MPVGERVIAAAAVAGLLTTLALAGPTLAAAAAPVAPTAVAAPTPTSTAASPEAPDPNPPLGGTGPGGYPVGGQALLDRGVLTPAGAPALPPDVTAAGWALVDLDSGAVLAARDPHGRYQPASILKTLTALVLLPRLPGAAKIPVSGAAAATEGSAVGLVPGGAYTADVLFQAMFLMSGNDAVAALSDAAGGSPAVVAAMNATAQKLGAYDTLAQTPTGLDGWQQLTSAYDMALILRAAMAQPRFIAYDETERSLLPAQNVAGKAVGTIEMDNQSADFLTGYPGALVAKTGFTDAARHTFLAAADRGGRRLGVVLLRAERVPKDQWQQAAALFDWGFALPAATSPVGRLDGPVAPPVGAPAVTPTSAAAVPPAPATPPSTRGVAQLVGASRRAADGSATSSPVDTTVALTTSSAGPRGGVLYGAVVALLVALLAVIELRGRRRSATHRRT